MSTLPPPQRPAPRPAPRSSGPVRGIRLLVRRPRRRWVRWTLIGLGVTLFFGVLVTGYFWVKVAHEIDARLAGEARPIPRIYGRPFEIQTGRGLSPAQLVQRLNDVGYAQRPKAALPGEFSLAPNSVLLITRPADKAESRTVRVDFTTGASPVIRRMVDPSNKPASGITLEAPLLAAIAPGQKRRKVPLAADPRIHETGRPRHRGSPVLPAPGRRSDPHSRRAHQQPPRKQAVPRRRVHDHAADHQEHVPDARANAGAQAPGTVHGPGAGLPFHQGPDLRAVPERSRARPARPVRDPRRRRSRAHLLRQGRQQRQPGGGRDHCGHHPGAVRLQPLPQSQERARATRRRSGGDGGRRLHHRRRREDRGEPSRSRSRRARSKTKRRTSWTTSADSWTTPTKA